jgi:hypothetical protein
VGSGNTASCGEARGAPATEDRRASTSAARSAEPPLLTPRDAGIWTRR